MLDIQIDQVYDPTVTAIAFILIFCNLYQQLLLLIVIIKTIITRGHVQNELPSFIFLNRDIIYLAYLST